MTTTPSPRFEHTRRTAGEHHAPAEKAARREVLAPRDDLARDRAALEPELIEIRRVLHRAPELAFAEHRTAKLVADRLGAIGYEPRVGVGGTGSSQTSKAAGPARRC